VATALRPSSTGSSGPSQAEIAKSRGSLRDDVGTGLQGHPWRDDVHPNNAIRRIARHLAEFEALLAGAEPIPGTWHGRTVTRASDWAPFTEADLNEARNRLGRLGRLYAPRLRSLDDQALDDPRGQAWTIRQIVRPTSEKH
jgi:hypothetical protein